MEPEIYSITHITYQWKCPECGRIQRHREKHGYSTPEKASAAFKMYHKECIDSPFSASPATEPPPLR